MRSTYLPILLILLLSLLSASLHAYAGKEKANTVVTAEVYRDGYVKITIVETSKGGPEGLFLYSVAVEQHDSVTKVGVEEQASARGLPGSMEEEAWFERRGDVLHGTIRYHYASIYYLDANVSLELKFRSNATTARMHMEIATNNTGVLDSITTKPELPLARVISYRAEKLGEGRARIDAEIEYSSNAPVLLPGIPAETVTSFAELRFLARSSAHVLIRNGSIVAKVYAEYDAPMLEVAKSFARRLSVIGGKAAKLTQLLGYAERLLEVKPSSTASFEIKEKNGTTMTRIVFPEVRARGSTSPRDTLAAIKKLAEKAVSLGLMEEEALNTTVRLKPAEPGIRLHPAEARLADLDKVDVRVERGSALTLVAAGAVLGVAAALIVEKTLRRHG